jgi:signal transduction histidine kinase
MFIGLYNNIINAGVNKARRPEDISKIKYLNYCLFFGVLVFIPNIIYEAWLRLPVTVIADVVFLGLIFITYLINTKGYYNAARNLAIVSCNFILVAGNYAEGVAAGNYLEFIPLFFVFSILGKLKDEYWQIAFLMLLTACGLLVSLFVFPTYSNVQQIDAAVVKQMYNANFFIAVFLTLVFSFLIYRITQKKEEELTRAKELAEDSAKVKMQFLSNMSHELRTPLNGIIGTVNLLNLEDHNNHQRDHYELLQYSSSHMLNLINDLLDFSKIESGKVELEKRDFNVETFVKNIYNSFAQQFENKQLYLKLATEDDLNFNITSDDIKLGQILNNLLSNALKFTHKGGVTLGVKTRQMEEEKIAILFSVTDTGVGIPATKANKIFESFIQADVDTTRKYGGTGLGLSISKKLTEVYESELKLETTVNEGSRFYFEVVFTKSKNAAKPLTAVPENMRPLMGLRILIAEDNKINMLIARKFLIKWGVELTEAVNGREAVEFCKTKIFDIVLLDLEMPEVDGYTALQEIRKIKPNIPAMAFTAAVFEDIEDVLIKQKGFNDYILKPFTPKELNNKLYHQQAKLLVN